MDIELLASFSKSVAGFCYETFLQFRILRISDININNGSRKVGFEKVIGLRNDFSFEQNGTCLHLDLNFRFVSG